jgi:hypothetical protein
MKKSFTLLFAHLFYLLSMIQMVAQPTIEDNFFDRVDYIGAFGSVDWTSGWSNWTPQTANYPATTDVISAGDITTNTTLTADKVYLLDGWVYVKSGATLTIEPGTIIRGSKANKGALIIEKGARIMAEGTESNPIVFTSNQDVGSRSYGDWGGVIILGQATVNKVDPVIEGGPTSTYGGSDDTDNSGIFKYVRIEFAGIAFQPDKEINGLTFGGVGSGTEIEYVQVSFSGDDSYEWFGGTVNAKHLIAFRGWDDDFDTDYGYRGMVQFAVSLRDPAVADAGSGSNSFESDNDGTGTDETPITQTLFSNVSSFGPLVTPETTVNPNFKRAMHLRRNTKLNIYNSVFAGYMTGLFIDGAASQANATAGDLKIRNTYMAGCNDFYADTFDSTYFVTEGFANMAVASNSELEIADPFNLEDPDFIPTENSPLLTASVWYEGPVTSVSDVIAENTFNVEVFPNPFSGSARIGLTLKSSSHVSIKLYNVTGTLVQTLVNEPKITGYHEFTINVAQNGIYLANIQVNETRQVIKLVAR